jgi:hypothetical protein
MRNYLEEDIEEIRERIKIRYKEEEQFKLKDEQYKEKINRKIQDIDNSKKKVINRLKGININCLKKDASSYSKVILELINKGREILKQNISIAIYDKINNILISFYSIILHFNCSIFLENSNSFKEFFFGELFLDEILLDNILDISFKTEQDEKILKIISKIINNTKKLYEIIKEILMYKVQFELFNKPYGNFIF